MNKAGSKENSTNLIYGMERIGLLICDEPLIFPHTDQDTRMIGPIYHTGGGSPVIDWGAGKTVYLTIGISGVPESLIYLSKILVERGYDVMVSTGFSVKKEAFPESGAFMGGRLVEF